MKNVQKKSVHDLVSEQLENKAREAEVKGQKGKAETKSSKIKAERPAKAAKKNSGAALAPDRLMMLVTVVNREKREYFLDLIQSFQCNMQFSCLASGTASKALGLLSADTEKAVIFSIVTKENSQLALYTLQKKFTSIRGGKGVAFTVPMTSTIGVLVYRFLSNKE